MAKKDVTSALADGSGASGATCHSMIRWLQAQQPTIHMWENVPDLLQARHVDNLQWFIQALLGAGFVCAYSSFVSSEYGHPTSRARAYGVCLNIRRLTLTNRMQWPSRRRSSPLHRTLFQSHARVQLDLKRLLLQKLQFSRI